MAVSSTMPAVTSILYVKGSARITPITRVRPGSTPISSPIVMPSTSTSRCSGVKQFRKPTPRCCSISIIGCSLLALQLLDQQQVHHGLRDLVERRLTSRDRYVDDLDKDEGESENSADADEPHREVTTHAGEIHENDDERERRGDEPEHRHRGSVRESEDYAGNQNRSPRRSAVGPGLLEMRLVEPVADALRASLGGSADQRPRDFRDGHDRDQHEC